MPYRRIEVKPPALARHYQLKSRHAGSERLESSGLGGDLVASDAHRHVDSHPDIIASLVAASQRA